jgi:hypothetical protein
VLEDDRRRRDGWLAEAMQTELSAEERELLARLNDLQHAPR